MIENGRRQFVRAFFLRLAISFLLMMAVHGVGIAQNSEAAKQYQYASQLASDGLLDLATTQFEDFLQRYPDSPKAPEAYLRLGDVYRKMGELDKSDQSLRALLVKFPDFPRCDEALFHLAENHISRNETQKAASILERFSLFYSKSDLAPTALLLAGNLWFKHSQFLRAEEDWKRVVEEYPESKQVGVARIQLAKLFLQQRKLKEAQAQAQKVVSQNPETGLLLKSQVLLGQIFAAQYKLQEAEAAFQEALKNQTSPSLSLRAKLAYAEFLLNNNRSQEARALLQSSIPPSEKSTLHDSLRITWLKILQRDGDDTAVLDALNRFAPSFTDSLLFLCALEEGIRSAQRMNESEILAELLRKRLRTRADSSLAEERALFRVQLIRTLMSLNRDQEALHHCSILLESQTARPIFRNQARFYAGQIYLKKFRQPAQALYYFEQILRPGNKSFWADEAAYHVGICYERLGESQRALQIWKNFSQAFPGSPLQEDVNRKLRWYAFYSPSPEGQRNSLSALALAMFNGNREEALLTLLQSLFSNRDYQTIIRASQQNDLLEVVMRHPRRGLRLLAESFYRLALRDSTVQSAYLDSARNYYLQYLSAAPESEDRVKTALRVHEIDRLRKNLTTLNFLDEYDFLSKLRNRVLSLPDRILVDFQLARLLQDYGTRTSPDSLYSALNFYKGILSDLDSLIVSSEDRSLFVSLDGSDKRDFIKESAIYQTGTILAALKDTARAMAAFEQYLNQYPTGRYAWSAHLSLTRLLLAREKWRAAAAHLKNMVERFYYHERIDSLREELASVQIKLEKPGEAFHTLQNIQHPSEKALYLKAVVLKEVGRFAEARNLCLQYLRRYKDGLHLPNVYLLLAEMAQESRQREEASFYRQTFLRRFPDDQRSDQIRMTEAENFFRNKDFTRALEIYQQLLKAHPDDPELLKRSWLCQIKLGQVSRVIGQIKAKKDLFKEQEELLAEVEYQIGEYYLERKSYERAEKQFEKVKSDYKRTAYKQFAEYSLGKLRLIRDHIEDGLEILTKIADQYPSHPVISEVYLTLGDFYYKSKQFGNAVVAFNKVLDSNPDPEIEKTAERYLIKLYSDIGQYESGLIALKRFLRKYPDDPEAFVYKINVGITLFNLHEYLDSIEHLRSLLALADNEHEAEIRYWIGKNYFQMGQFRQAIAEYMKIPYLTKPTKLPWHVTAEYESALSYMKLKEYDRARELFNKIVKREGAGSDFGRFALMKLREIQQLQEQE